MGNRVIWICEWVKNLFTNSGLPTIRRRMRTPKSDRPEISATVSGKSLLPPPYKKILHPVPSGKDGIMGPRLFKPPRPSHPCLLLSHKPGEQRHRTTITQSRCALSYEVPVFR